MPDVFISHASADIEFARFLHRHLTSEGVSVFLAPVSLAPGQQWSREILGALQASTWVLVLASRAACASAWVHQELGAALAAQKKVVPIVWDISPTQLPGWLAHFQPLNLAGASADEIQKQISAIAERIKADKAKGLLIGGLLLAGLFALASKG